MKKLKTEHFIIIFLFIAANILYVFAERDTRELTNTTVAASVNLTDTLVHSSAGNH